MSKLKNYIMNSVEKQVDNITNDYLAGKYNSTVAKNKISTIDNLEMVMEEHNIDDHLYFAKQESQAEVALTLQGGK